MHADHSPQKKQHRYSLCMVSPSGDIRQIIESEPSFERVRSVACGIKKKPGRKLTISRDGKELPGGPNALDAMAYQVWLESHQPDIPEIPIEVQSEM